MRIAFDCVGTLVNDVSGNETNQEVLSFYREIKQNKSYSLIVWSSDFDLARRVMSRYHLQADRLAQKNTLDVDLALDDVPEGVTSAGSVIDVTRTGWQDKARIALKELTEKQQAKHQGGQ